jgi:Flp pilus assembly protein TadD
MSVPIFTRTLLIAAVSAVVGGCADSMLYTQQARRDGFADFQDGDYVNATAVLQNVTLQDPNDYEAYYVLGESYQAEGHHEQAIGAYRTCLDVMPLTLKGEQDLLLHSKCVDKLATAIADSPSYDSEITAMENKAKGQASVDQLWMLAKTYAAHGDADEAVERYNEAVHIDSSQFDLDKEAGLYEARLKQNEWAVATLRKAYAVNPDDDDVNKALRSLGVFPGATDRPMARI